MFVNGMVCLVGDVVVDGDVVEVLARIRSFSSVAAAYRVGERVVVLVWDDLYFVIMVKLDDCVSVGKGSDLMKWSVEWLCVMALTSTSEGVEGALSRFRSVYWLDEFMGGLLVCVKMWMVMMVLLVVFEK